MTMAPRPLKTSATKTRTADPRQVASQQCRWHVHRLSIATATHCAASQGNGPSGRAHFSRCGLPPGGDWCQEQGPVFRADAKGHEVPGQQFCVAEPVAPAGEGMHRAGLHTADAHPGEQDCTQSLAHGVVTAWCLSAWCWRWSALTVQPVTAVMCHNNRLRVVTRIPRCRLPVFRWRCWDGTSAAAHRQVLNVPAACLPRWRVAASHS